MQQARNEAAEFRFRYGYEMPVDVLARWLANSSPDSGFGVYYKFWLNLVSYIDASHSVYVKGDIDLLIFMLLMAHSYSYNFTIRAQFL